MNLKGFVLLVVSLFIFTSFISAVTFPQGFYGTVYYFNGTSVNSGTIITKMTNLNIGQGEIVNGNYNLVVESETNFGTISFYLNDDLHFLIMVPFNSGNVTELNFIIPLINQTNNNQTIINNTKVHDSYSCNHKDTSFINFCDVNWKCSGWSSCTNGMMTRVCIDINDCDYKYNKPLENTGCKITNSKSLIENKKINLSFFLTFSLIITILLLLILLCLIFIKR